MSFPNIFSTAVVNELIDRINKLKPDTRPGWGRMSVDQMLAHVNVAYELTYTPKQKRPSAFMRWIIRILAKEMVTGSKPYPKNGRTAPAFIIRGRRDFELEKARLIGFLQTSRDLGEAAFDGRENYSFGKLTLDEWNTLFYKHLDHHLRQFNV